MNSLHATVESDGDDTLPSAIEAGSAAWFVKFAQGNPERLASGMALDSLVSICRSNRIRYDTLVDEIARTLKIRAASINRSVRDKMRADEADQAEVEANAAVRRRNVAEANKKDWQKALVVSDRGAPVGNVHNALQILRGHELMRGVLQYDAIARKTMMAKRAPWIASKADEDGKEHPFQRRHWNDRDDTLCTAWIQKQGIPVNRETVGSAVEVIAHEHRVNPVQEYLEACHAKWIADGRKVRLDKWLSIIYGTPCDHYHAEVGKRWLTAAAARALRPGCKADNMLVIQGAQGLLKSTSIRDLMPIEDWFTDHLGDLGSKDAAMQLEGRWIIEIAELDALGKKEVSTVKAFVTTRIDKIRRPYNQRVEDLPRTCLFAGTVNNAQYLRDETGNRRFWPITAKKVEIGLLQRDRDLLWGEAVEVFLTEKRWWLDKKTEAMAGEAQRERHIGDVWDEQLDSYIEDKEREAAAAATTIEWQEKLIAQKKAERAADKKINSVLDLEITNLETALKAKRAALEVRISVSAFLAHIGIETKEQTQRDANRVAGMLTHRGFTVRQIREGGDRVRRYVRA